MTIEIEHKFLVCDDSWRKDVYRSERMVQGYLNSDERCSVRVRIGSHHAYLNIKSGTLGVSRTEYDYAIPLPDARVMLAALCIKPLIEKTRHWVRHGTHIWEVDVFEGANAGLVIAEVELGVVGESFCRPPWVGAEVSHEPRYYNPSLVVRPYRSW